MRDEEEQDEVSFWKEMIQQWEALHAAPVPQRMREALAHAESKFLVLRETLAKMTGRLH